jgi:peptidoglycan/xylan/chitin deacetylase (PgdA/CDA1 family)
VRRSSPASYVGQPEPLIWPGIERWAATEHAGELHALDWDQLRELQGSGWEIGSHSDTHRRLTAIDDELLATELRDSRQRIEEELGSACRTLAYPYGAHDSRVRAAARAAGYQAAAGIRPGGRDPFCWPRIGVYPADQSWRFRLKASPWLMRVRGSRFGQVLESPRRLRARPAS